jgi:hypothetical protein
MGYKTTWQSGRLDLEPDPDQVAEIRVIVDKVLAGQSVNGVAVEHGIDPRTLHKRLKRVELKGWATYNDEIVRDGEGLPVMRPPIIDARTWDRLQAKLQANSKGAGVPHDAVPWQAKRRVLIDAGVRTEARREVRYTTELMTDRWLSLETDHERGALLRSMGVRIMARKAGPAQTRIRLQQGSRHWADVVREWTDEDVRALHEEPDRA